MSRFVPNPRQQKLQSTAFISCVALLICGIAAQPNISAIRGAVFIGPGAYKTTVGTITKSCSSYIGGKSSLYSFNINYSYSANGQKYNSDQVNFGVRASKDKAFADAYAHQYPVGMRTVVYYKADEPTFAVLEPQNIGITRNMFWSIAALSLFCTGAFTVSMWQLAREKRQ
ncbi:DUF3592 domain-containing protein [bacterium]|nr:MAG: DUF3592 domain-containing protein [bacterium]